VRACCLCSLAQLVASIPSAQAREEHRNVARPGAPYDVRAAGAVAVSDEHDLAGDEYHVTNVVTRSTTRVQAAIATIARGGMVLVADDQGRENETDLIMDAACVDTATAGRAPTARRRTCLSFPAAITTLRCRRSDRCRAGPRSPR